MTHWRFSGRGRNGRTRKLAASIMIAVAGAVALAAVGALGTAAQVDGDDVTIRVRARGTTGTEQMWFLYDGERSGTQSVGTSWEISSIQVPIGTDTFFVRFGNDGLTATGADRNLLVDWIEVDGPGGVTRVESESEDILSQGVWNGTDCDQGYRESEFLACNGWLRFKIGDLTVEPPPPPPDGTEPITIRAAGRVTGEELAVSINGRFIEFFDLTTTTVRDYTFDIPTVTDGPLRVEFVNDNGGDRATDRDAYIPEIVFRGTTYDTTTLFSKGVWNGTDCSTGFRESPWLNCNGWFQVPLDGDPPPPNTETLEGRVIAYGSTGTEIIGFEANGVLIDSWTVTNDGVGRTVDVPVPESGLEQVRVVFLNDGLTDTGGDRNVRFDWIELDNWVYDIESLLSKGVWNGTDCDVGYRNSAWLHCNGWLELDSDPAPPPPSPPTNLACRSIDGSFGFGPWVTEWTWENSSDNTSIQVIVDDGETNIPFVLDPGTTRFVHESVDGFPRVVEIAAVDGDALGVAELPDCGRSVLSNIATLLTVPAPNSVEVTFNAVLADYEVDHFDVQILGSELDETVRATALGSGFYSATFENLPEDEVLVISVFTCYGVIPFESCTEDGGGIRYHPWTQVYVPSDGPPANPALPAPTDVQVDPVEEFVTWTPVPNDTGGQYTYQVRALLPDGFTELQLAEGALVGRFGITGDRIRFDTTLFYNWLPESDHRWEVRTCTNDGCGPWSESTDWLTADGTTRPYQP